MNFTKEKALEMQSTYLKLEIDYRMNQKPETKPEPITMIAVFDEDMMDPQNPERTKKFQAWMESLNDQKVRRASGEGYSTVKFERNYSTSRR